MSSNLSQTQILRVFTHMQILDFNCVISQGDGKGRKDNGAHVTRKQKGTIWDQGRGSWRREERMGLGKESLQQQGIMKMP